MARDPAARVKQPNLSVSHNEWQIVETRAALKEADAGDKEVVAWPRSGR